jgi:hypothetical protein
MDDIGRQFFHAPASSVQRRYEALRAFFIERRLLRDIAHDFGFEYGSLRNLVAEFRRQCQQGTVAPFWSIPHAGDQSVPSWRHHRSHRPLPIADNSPSLRVNACAPASRASSCSCHCWHVSASITW